MEKELQQLETAINELHKSNDITKAGYSTLTFALKQVKNCSIPNVRLSLPDSIENLNLNGIEFTDEEPLFSPMQDSEGEIIEGEYGLMLFCKDKRQ